MKEGKVYLVGAGPGDPGLISVKGLDCLRQADVIIYDRLVDEQLLESTPGPAEKIFAGKAAREHAREQDEINELLVAKAKEGKTVVRLKGGDPFVLGRGGEEAEYLRQNHIPCEIVPGVSSAVAVPAYAGIPVTRRGLASSFAVVTGHEDPSKGHSSIAWEKLATAVDTLIFLMGMENLPQIVASLLKYGRPLDTPVAVIKDGTKPNQETVVGTLENIVQRAKERGLSAPVVIVVGEVVQLRETLRWFDDRPLFGKRILVTRARHQASTLSRLLAERGAQPIELPTIEIRSLISTEELDRAILRLGDYQWLVFTSVNGVNAFFARLSVLKRDVRALSGLNVGAIGPATASALETKGIVADYVPPVYTSEGFVSGLASLPVAGKRFLLLRADIADKKLAHGIRRLGAEAHEVPAYRTVPAAIDAPRLKEMLATGEIDVITFTSSSTVANLVAKLEGKASLNSTRIACIGPKTADAAARAGLHVDIVATEHTLTGLVAAIEEYFKKET